MRKTILLLLSYMAVAQGQVVITSTEATSKEVVVRYLAPPRFATINPCTIQASYTNDFSSAYVPLPDVDPVQFPGSDTDTLRNPKPFVGRSRTVVIGKQIPYWRTLPASATTGYRESLAVKTAETIYIKISCDDASATATVSTKTVPFGLTFGEATPADPNAPGFPNWPSVKWGSTQTIIDPEYGTELKRPEAAGTRGVATAIATPQEASGSDWANPQYITADDANSATVSASQSPLSIIWPYASLPVGSVSQFPGDSSGLDWIQLTLKASGSASAVDDRTAQACLSIDTGVTCYTPWHDIVLTNSQATYTYPKSPVPGDHWQAAGDRPIPRQWLAKRSGAFQYSAATSTVTITSGDHVGEKWGNGTRFRSYRSTLNITRIVSGTPLTVTTAQAHGLATGDHVMISTIDKYKSVNPPAGSCAFLATGAQTVTVVDATTFTLNGVGGNCTYGLTGQSTVSTSAPTAAGSPPTIYVPNSWYPNGSYAAISGCTDAGWTSLNGNVYQLATVNGDEQVFTITGATTAGSYTGGCKAAIVTGLAQPYADYPINSIVDGTHFTLTSGPAVDITTPVSWSVDPVSVLLRKKTASADSVSLQFAQVKIQTSAGNAWGAAGGEICASYDVPGAEGKLGSICMVGSTPMWIPRDGSAAQPFGSIPLQNATDLGNLGMGCVSGAGTDQGSLAVNPNDPKRMYCSRPTRTYAPGGNPYGYDRSILVAEYEGDFTPRPSSETTEASITSQYPGYGSRAPVYPWLPNCYGDGKFNDGVNPRIVPTKCVSYKQIVPSIQDMIVAADAKWQQFTSQKSHLPCNGAAGPRMNFVYRASTDSVWASILCGPYAEQGGIVYVFDLGNEKPTSDSTSTVRVVAGLDSWSTPGGRWSKYHGGAGLRDGYVVQFPHPSGIASGTTYAFDYNQACVLCGPWWTDYTVVDNVPGAWLTNAVGSCAAWAGSPYLPTPVPDGTGGIGCNTVVVSHEPCDSSPDSEEVAIRDANPGIHASKCGSSGPFWLQDAVVGDVVLIDHDADRDYQHLEPAILIAKDGNTWALYRGGVKRVNNGSGGYAGVINHTGDTKRLLMTFSYDTSTGGYPVYYRAYDPPGTVLTQKLTMGHGAVGNFLSAGSNGSNYGVVKGDVQQRLAATAFDFTVASRGLPFEGKRANDVLSTDSHMTYVESAALTNKDPWVVDCAPWNGYDGIAPTGPVAGTTTVYRWTAAQLNGSIYTNQFPKFLAPEVRVGVWVARNISGPGSVIDDSKPYTFCEVYAAGECISGSAVGDVYVAAPVVDQLASKYQCCGADFTGLRDIAISSVNSTFSRCTQTVLRNDATGGTGRALTTSLHMPRAEDSFKNMSVTNTGALGVMRERGTEFVKSELFTMTMPPIVFDGIDRTHFWQQTITFRPYFGADNVLVRFGYEHYGDVASRQYFCTTRKENCVIGAGTSSANPFYFESTDTYNGISCAGGCTATLPLIPNRVAYYEVVFRSGTTVLYTMPQQVVVSP